jgi:hypothetical protein
MLMSDCRHGRYLTDYHTTLDTFERATVDVWHCLRCGALLEKVEVGKASKYTVVGYDPMARIDEVWMSIKNRAATGIKP